MKFIVQIEKDGRYLVRKAGLWGLLLGGTSCGLSSQIVRALIEQGMPISDLEIKWEASND